MFKFLGKQIENVQVDPQWPFGLQKSYHTLDVVFENKEGHELVINPRDLLALCMFALKKRAEETIGKKITKVSLRNLKGMDASQKGEIRSAALLCGFIIDS